MMGGNKSQLNSDLQAIMKLAQSMAEDMRQSEEKILDLIVIATAGKRAIRDPNTGKIKVDEKTGLPLYVDVDIDDMMQSVFILLCYIPHKVRRGIPQATFEALMKYSSCVRDYETRSYKKTVLVDNELVKVDVFTSLDKADIMKHKVRMIISTIMTYLSPNINKMTKGFSADNFQTLSQSQKPNQDPFTSGLTRPGSNSEQRY